MTTRREFCGAIAGVGTAVVGLHASTAVPVPSPAAREISEAQADFEDLLRAQMENPLTLTIQIDGQEIARQTVSLAPKLRPTS